MCLTTKKQFFKIHKRVKFGLKMKRHFESIDELKTYLEIPQGTPKMKIVIFYKNMIKMYTTCNYLFNMATII